MSRWLIAKNRTEYLLLVEFGDAIGPWRKELRNREASGDESVADA